VGFKKGEGGRPKGALNRSTLEFRLDIQKLKHRPGQALVECYNRAIEEFEHYSSLLKENRISGMEDNGWRYLKIAADTAKEIASYLYPKRKAVDLLVQKSPEEERPLRHLSNEELDQL
jgi:hypothetical protein